MSVYQIELNLRTVKKQECVDVTELIERTVTESGIVTGVCSIFVPHTTAAIIANEHFDPNVPRDIAKTLCSMVPDHGPWDHPEENAPAHVRASLLGSSLSVPVTSGELFLGQWQGIFFMEFDGPRSRNLKVTITG